MEPHHNLEPITESEENKQSEETQNENNQEVGQKEEVSEPIDNQAMIEASMKAAFVYNFILLIHFSNFLNFFCISRI